MKALKTSMLVVLILLVTFMLVQPVEARGHGGGHGGGGGGRRGGFGRGYHHAYYGGFGYGWWGYPYWWDYPYYPYYPYYDPLYYPYYDPYYYGGYGEPPVPPQGVTAPAASRRQQPSYWHFCQDPEGYYPYVKVCPGGWMTVVPSRPNAPPPSLGAPRTN